MFISSVSATTFSGYNNLSNKDLFFKFDQSSGTTVVNQVGTNDGTFSIGTPAYSSSISGFLNGTDFSGTQMFNTTFTGSASLTQNFTLEWRMKMSSQKMIMDWGFASGNGFSLGIDGAGKLSVAMDVGGQTNNNGIVLTDNKWHHFLIVRQDDLFQFWEDGVNTFNRTSALGALTTPLEFGYDTSGYWGNAHYVGSLDQVVLWNRILTTAERLAANLSDSGGIGVPIVTPILITPSNNSNNYVNPLMFNASMNTTYGNLVNSTLFVYNSTGSIYNTSTNLVSGSSNYSIWNIPINSFGTYTYGVRSCANNSGIVSCAFTSNNTFNWGYTINNESFNATTYETSIENYVLNISLANIYSVSNAVFNYSGTQYSATVSNTGNNYIISYQREIPLEVGSSHQFNWIITLNNSNSIISTNKTQTVRALIFNICNATLNSTFINFTFKDESNLANLNATIPSSTFEYWVGDGSLTKSLTFINNTANPSYAFCSNAPSTLSLDPYVQYASSGYPQRVYTVPTLTLTNSTTNKILYLLSSSSGIYTTFQLLSGSGSPLQGVSVNATRQISGIDTLIGLGTTDAAGLVTLWVNPDYQHNFTFHKEGYENVIYTTYPTQTSYTITMGGGSVDPPSDYSRGIVKLVRPSVDFISSDTVYSFNYTITSSYWTLDEWGFTLRYVNGSLIGSQSSTNQAGGTLNLNANTTNSARIIMYYYYTVNGSTRTESKYWNTQSQNSFSISHFFTDLALYIDSDLYGILENDNGDFGRALISVIILIGSVYVLSYRYGIVSEAAIMGFMFGIVLVLDNLNFIPNPDFMASARVTMGQLISTLVLLIMVGFIVKEERQ
jgi:hypothetical protein